jgi:dihydroorotate dehydrogenase electron transfer subunit
VIRQKCEVLSTKKWGVYNSVTLVAPEIADQARPGQFVEISVPEGRDFILRRPFSIAQASRKGGWAGTIEIAFAEVGPGTEWMGRIGAHDFLDVVGPLGKAFPFPRQPNSCLMVAGGYGAAPIYFLAQELRSRGKRVDMIVGARNQERLFKPVEAKRLSVTVALATEDGSVGELGKVTDLLPGMVMRCESEVVYACGPNGMLRAVAEYCTEQGIPTQVAVEELMACGLGVCWSCVVPVVRKDGKAWEYLRSCVDGPVFSGSRVWWEKWLGGRTRPINTPPQGFKLDELTPPGTWRAG